MEPFRPLGGSSANIQYAHSFNKCGIEQDSPRDGRKLIVKMLKHQTCGLDAKLEGMDVYSRKRRHGMLRGIRAVVRNDGNVVRNL